jgi:hypothetical protein
VPPGFSGQPVNPDRRVAVNKSKSKNAMKQLIAICLIGLFLLGCTSVRVKDTEAAAGFALNKYRTFGFYEISANGEAVNPAYNHQVELLKSTIRQQLTAKGLTFSPADPDLLVNIGVVTREKVQTRQTDFRTDAPKYIGQRRYSWRSEEVEVGRYKEGTVSVHLVDRESNALVWKGAMEAIIPRREARLQKTIDAGMARLFQSL